MRGKFKSGVPHSFEQAVVLEGPELAVRATWTAMVAAGLSPQAVQDRLMAKASRLPLGTRVATQAAIASMATAVNLRPNGKGETSSCD